ncbi:MAG TPA: aryl-sulfate sulfotransferase [Terriglobia bacterium]|nr:aryl-sulfate sulfotransferase [Terriglobia bacterium]
MTNLSLPRVACMALGALAVLMPVFGGAIQTPAVNQPAGGPSADGLGLLRHAPGAYKGYTLISPERATASYLVDMEGRLIKSWETGLTAGAYGLLLENGHLLRAGAIENSPYGGFVAGGGGRIQEYDWDGNLIWDYTLATESIIPHHDFVRLPNGNVILVVQEKKTAAEAAAAGRAQGIELHPDALLEIKPTGKTTGEVVWEWHLWDHLIQDRDASKANYGEVAAHPELMDFNFGVGAGRGNADWAHQNAVAYNAELDQLMLSMRSFSEVFIVDHSTTTKEAAGHTGGRSGKGGDILYRWGNPQTYRRGAAEDQRSFGQHNVQWIARGLPGAGHLLLFNNGDTRPGQKYSTVDEVVLPGNAKGEYTLEPGKKYGPDQPVWTYMAPNPTDFYSSYISGTQRLPNGNTLICAGAIGMVFEVTPDKQVVWQYNFPSFGQPGGFGGPGGGPGGARGGRGAGGFGARGPAQARGGGPPRGGAPGGGAAPARGTPGPTNTYAIFRAYRYGPDFPGFAGKTLTPGKPIEEVAAESR